MFFILTFQITEKFADQSVNHDNIELSEILDDAEEDDLLEENLLLFFEDYIQLEFKTPIRHSFLSKRSHDLSVFIKIPFPPPELT